MKIDYTNHRFYDMDGREIFENDIVFMDGRNRKVFKTENGDLGVDATNPKWIEIGRAVEGEWGIYTFCEDDKPYIVAEAAYKGSHHLGEIVDHHGHECVVLLLWTDDKGKSGISIKPTGNYGFQVDLYEEQL